MKESYSTLEVEVIKFNSEDVITVSCTGYKREEYEGEPVTCPPDDF